MPFHHMRVIVLVAVGFSLAEVGCNSDNPAAPTAAGGGPFIASVTPAQARSLTDIWLSGSEFLTTSLGQPTVRFNFGRFEVNVTPSEASNTQLRVTVPDIDAPQCADSYEWTAVAVDELQ